MGIVSSCHGFVICPYCDPEHDPYPNIKEALRGYDVPMGNPNPTKGNYDPGVRNQIFVPTVRNRDGYYALDTSFITANAQIKVQYQLYSLDILLLSFLIGDIYITQICISFFFSAMQRGRQISLIHISSMLMAKKEPLLLDSE